MKKIILILILSLTISSINAQIKMLYDSEKSEKEKIFNIINSGFKNINILRVDIDEVEWQSDTTLITEIQISDDNKTFTEINKSPYSKTVVKLDGDVLSREIFNQNNQLSGKTIYSYSKAGMIEKRELYFGDLKAFDEVFEIEGNKLIKMKYFTSDGTLISYSDFEYDSKSNLTKENKYNSAGVLDYVYEYIYDSENKISEEIIIMENGKKTFINYSYGSNNLINEKITKDSNGKVMSSLKFVYDGKNVTEEYYETPELKLKKTFTYKNNLLHTIKFLDILEANSYLWLYVYTN